MNGGVEFFPTTSVQVQIMGIARKKIYEIDLLTINNVCGGMKPFDWSEHAKKFTHLNKIPFPKPVKEKTDVLIGLDNSDHHRTLREIVSDK